MSETNTVPTRDMTQSITGCCPPFDPVQWDDKRFVFRGKLFIKLTTRSLFYIPLTMSKVMDAATKAVQKEGAANNEYLMLSRELSPWRAEHLLAVQKPIPGYEQVILSGTFLTKVFEGPYGNVRKWHKELTDFVTKKGATPEMIYFDYAYCPRCSHAYGHWCCQDKRSTRERRRRVHR